ncbi:hypothetical protein CDAR_229541 [Caerostris darwini]|uniref:Uncharacterized protein n=1 Tax=Caerostris darwini TaxID=1538125 RepID=A0AAV4Q137_9ARAC|nr:hypothetical protein CDAR_229541 [Caerostris darwini]
MREKCSYDYGMAAEGLPICKEDHHRRGDDGGSLPSCNCLPPFLAHLMLMRGKCSNDYGMAAEGLPICKEDRHRRGDIEGLVLNSNKIFFFDCGGSETVATLREPNIAHLHAKQRKISPDNEAVNGIHLKSLFKALEL